MATNDESSGIKNWIVSKKNKKNQVFKFFTKTAQFFDTMIQDLNYGFRFYRILGVAAAAGAEAYAQAPRSIINQEFLTNRSRE